MDVTRHNFTEVLSELDKILKKALFISIDGEFTGLNAGENTCALDTPTEYYKKIRNGALDFLLVQFGLAVFSYDEETNKYTHKAYNFYVFPRPSIRSAPDSRFLSQASCLDFLAKNNFNFNKLFLEGIPYLNRNDEQVLRDKLEERRKDRQSLITSPPLSGGNYIEIPEEHKQTVATACNKISEFLQDTSVEELTLDSCNGFVRKLIYQEAWKKFSRDDLILETKQYNIVARRAGTPEQRKKLEQEKKDQEDAEISEAVGFSHLIRMLSEANKLIVGHNMLLDLCHILHRFCMPLPEDYEDFKDMLHCLFSKILDTKYLCSYPEIKDKVPSSVLGHILATVAEKPFELISVAADGKGCGYSVQDEKAHEAGYDAYITGLIFLSLSNYLGTLQTPAVAPVLPTSHILKKFINKLFLMKISDTHINLEGPDPEVNREHVFHLTFPKEWTHQEINQLFSPYGNIYITWLTDTTAFVSLNNKEHTLSVTRNLVRNKKRKQGGVKVMTYHSYISSLQKPAVSDIFCKQSPSIHVAKKRKLADTQNWESPKKRRSRSYDKSRASSSKRSIDSIPEEDESYEEVSNNAEHKKDKVQNSHDKNNTAPINNTSLVNAASPTAVSDNQDRFFEENEDWN